MIPSICGAGYLFPGQNYIDIESLSENTADLTRLGNSVANESAFLVQILEHYFEKCFISLCLI
jgi:hypothetical protein